MSVGEIVIDNPRTSDDEVLEETGEDNVIEAVTNSPPESNTDPQQVASTSDVKCLKYGKKFATVGSLKRHVGQFHMPGQNHQCNICDKGGVKQFLLLFENKH